MKSDSEGMKSNKKTRNEYVQAIVNVGSDGLTINYDPISKKLSFEGAERQLAERTYDRESGKPKVLSRIPAGADGACFDSIDTIQSNFDILVAIDTNTRKIRGRSCSVTGVIAAQPAWAGAQEGPLQRCWQYFSPFCIEFADLSHPPEKVGWAVALQSLDQKGLIKRSMRVGVVVDAHLSEHERINSRKIPFDGYSYLPLNLTLLYASSDAGKEDFINQLIGYADRVSQSALLRLRIDEIPPPDSSTARPGVWAGVRLLIPNQLTG